jgi:hypothetical protein
MKRREEERKKSEWERGRGSGLEYPVVSGRVVSPAN